MNLKRVKVAADRRGIYFSGEKKWLNSMVGYGYEFFTPDNWSIYHPDRAGFCQCNTLEQAYKAIMQYPVVPVDERY